MNPLFLLLVSNHVAFAAFEKFLGLCTRDGQDISLHQKPIGVISRQECEATCLDDGAHEHACLAYEYNVAKGECDLMFRPVNGGDGDSTFECYILKHTLWCEQSKTFQPHGGYKIGEEKGLQNLAMCKQACVDLGEGCNAVTWQQNKRKCRMFNDVPAVKVVPEKRGRSLTSYVKLCGEGGCVVDNDCLETQECKIENDVGHCYDKPTAEPTGATAEPTDATGEPTETTIEPTDATQEPTEATGEPTETTVEPTDATEEPTEATGEPTETTVEPTDATGEPTETTVEPTDATGEPTETTVEPTDATMEPTDATEEPTEATGEPTDTGSSESLPTDGPQPDYIPPELALEWCPVTDHYFNHRGTHLTMINDVPTIEDCMSECDDYAGGELPCNFVWFYLPDERRNYNRCRLFSDTHKWKPRPIDNTRAILFAGKLCTPDDISIGCRWDGACFEEDTCNLESKTCEPGLASLDIIDNPDTAFLVDTNQFSTSSKFGLLSLFSVVGAVSLLYGSYTVLKDVLCGHELYAPIPGHSTMVDEL